MAITAAQVKELREKTGAGMMDAKKALVETDGDMEKAIDVLREKGVAKAAKKGDRVAAEGLAKVAVDGDKAVLVELNSETDFVATNDKFKKMLDDIAIDILEHNPSSLEEVLALPMGDGTIQDEITNLTAVIGEKITLRRFELVKKNPEEIFGSYSHNGGVIVSLVKLTGDNATVAKDVAMHVAAVNPKYLKEADVPADVINHEKEVVTEETKAEGKPENIIPRIVEGRMKKFFSEICLVDQDYIKDPDMTVGKYVQDNKEDILSFVRFEVGEGIEKAEGMSFAEEVASQMKQN